MAYTTIDDPSAYFQTALYNGSSSSVTVTNDGNSNLQPDWLWFKKRNTTGDHNTFDTSRGLTERLFPNLTSAVDTGENGITSLTNGFTSGTFYGDVNGAGNTFVTWQWKANGGTTASNSDGSITSTVQANTTAGFSIVTYTGNGSAGATIGHGLGAVPSMFIIKRRSGAEDWVVYHHKNTSAPETDHLLLNTSDATSDSDTRFNDTAPTTTLITMGNNAVINGSGSTYVGYVFTEKQGYSKFGSYTGNGNANGPMVFCGFSPSWVMIKNTADSTNWNIYDNKRSTFNTADDVLLANANIAEGAVGGKSIDFLSNGFKLRGSDNETNDNGDVHIYIAFAESPFVSSEGVPTTAR